MLQPLPGEPATVPPVELLDFIKQGSRFIIAGHMEPDADCIGSQLALASALRRMGKEALPYSAGPFKRPEVKPYEHLFTIVSKRDGSPGELLPTEPPGTRALIVDCSSVDRTGDLEPLLKRLPSAIIDHHDTCCGQGGERPDYVDANALSTTLMVFKVITALGLELLKEEAELLFLGLCTDTGFFRHIDNGGAETFEAAAALIRCGACPKTAFAAMYGGKSFDSRRLLGHVLVRAESLFDGKLIVSSEEYEETCRLGLEGRDSDTLYQLLQSVDGVQAIVIIRQESPENCTVGFRSRDRIDVGGIAESFGGGGHKNAAGLSIAGTIPDIKPKIIHAFETVFTAHP